MTEALRIALVSSSYAPHIGALARRFRVPFVLSSHGEALADDNSAYAVSALLRGGMKYELGRAAVVTAPSEFVLSDLRERLRCTSQPGERR